MRRAATIRGSLAEGADGEQIKRLAALTGSRPPEGAMLLAELDGDAVAAIGIFDGHVISDPNQATFALRTSMRLLRLAMRVIVTMYGA